MTTAKLLTETEVAERLACSVSKIRQLRYRGLLPYIPGRPPLISEADFKVALQTELARVQSRKASARKRRKTLEEANPPDTAEVEAARVAAEIAAARRRGFVVALRRRLRSESAAPHEPARRKPRKPKLDGKS